MANSWDVSYVRERPSFEGITLYQLYYWKVTRIYGLTPEEIKDLLTNPDPQTPSHHQVDPRIIKAYLMGESVPTYLPREVPSHYYSGILPAYLPRDRFEPSEWVVTLVDDQYCQDYHTWKNCLDANTRATKSLVDHLTDPLYQVIEAPLSIPEPKFSPILSEL
jgi:ferritin-like protein